MFVYSYPAKVQYMIEKQKHFGIFYFRKMVVFVID